jgi:hypothetical protein
MCKKAALERPVTALASGMEIPLTQGKLAQIDPPAGDRVVRLVPHFLASSGRVYFAPIDRMTCSWGLAPCQRQLLDSRDFTSNSKKQ